MVSRCVKKTQDTAQKKSKKTESFKTHCPCFTSSRNILGSSEWSGLPPCKTCTITRLFHLQNDLFWPITLNFGSKLLKIFPPTKSWHKLSLLPSTAVTSLRSRLGSSTNNKQQQEVTTFLKQLTCYKHCFKATKNFAHPPSLQKLAHHGLPGLSQSPERSKKWHLHRKKDLRFMRDVS